MKRSTINFFTVLAILFSLNATAFTMRPNILLAAKLDGAQEVPVVSGFGVGVASFMFSPNRDSLCVNVTFTGLTGSVTGVNIHSANVGQTGPAVIDLMPFLSRNRITGIITGTALTQAIKSGMLRGLTYINIQTAANSGGEIRGQIRLETDVAYTGIIDGPQSATTSSATGYAVFNMSQDEKMVNFFIITSGLSGPVNSAHVHVGAPGVNGGVIMDIQNYLNGNVIVGSSTITANVASYFKSGLAYVNLHTNAFIQGEVRGQLRRDNKIGFDAWINGAQEVPAVTTNAKGLASLKLNTTMDSLWYYIYSTDLSGPVTNSHLHNGMPGVSGGVAAGFNPPSGNVITGTITGAALTSTLINNILRGATYVNIHTAANPSGEIRGQVYRNIREGYTFSMDGVQENPHVATDAAGSGIISINRNMDHAHYMMVTNGITPNSVQFFKGVKGTNGSIINDVYSVSANHGIFGYWTTNDSSPFSPFSTAIANQIDNDSVYVNAHTAAHPSGEIRGQIQSGFKCVASVYTTGLSKLNADAKNNYVLFPNPASGETTLSFFSDNNQDVSVSVFNIVGKKVYEKNFAAQNGTNNMRIDLSDQSAGVYLVRIKNNGGELTKKISVE